eukprot:CAMPEP_0177716370 /NCGR_PEP_ID=MMETSP0484_2-20121128/14477_1 /TAXON_ID=354590 /ORGANISM="Rhodomonas lens, Strain RHODO" /LENGTH=179 /DNA_ID=CAMNT_0019228403 /DNA_START=12 /DNA_END=551 /DNA_ORIENTATION=-
MASSAQRSALVGVCMMLCMASVEGFMGTSPLAGLGLRQHVSAACSSKAVFSGASLAQRTSRTVPSVSTLAMNGPMHAAIDKVVKDNKIVLFMKGNQDFPQCGFSNTVCQILKACNAQFEDINVLENELLRQGIKEYSQWPTIPQLYIDGEFLGGCDIVIDMYQSGELVEMVERVMAEAD